MRRAMIQVSLFYLSFAAILFGAAGHLNWPMAWAFLGIYLVLIVVTLVLADPGLIEERTRLRPGIKRWDLVLARACILLLFPVTLLVAGLDMGRFHWSPPVPTALQVLALLVFTAGTGFGCWAMVCNKFFATFVRIQADRGHYVITHGPYAYVRHPGYAGAIVAAVALPVVLESLYAWIPALLGAGLLVVRTCLEDATLRAELNGYAEYASRVRWRLLPGLW